MNTIKIGGQKYKLEDMPESLKNKIDEQLKKEGIKLDGMIDGMKENKREKVSSLIRKMFGWKNWK